MKRFRLGVAAIFLLGMLGVPGLAPKADATCQVCEHVFNSEFCFPGFPGRTGCTTTLTYCAYSGAFCDIIIVTG